MWKIQSDNGSKRIYTNSTTGSTCTQTMCYTDKDGNKWWGFDNLLSLPYTRNFAAMKVSSLFALGLSKDDLNNHVSRGKTLIKSDDKEKYEKLYAEFLDFETKANNATDAIKQMSALACIYYTLNDEPIDGYDNNLQIKKMSLMEADLDMHSFFFETANRYHGKLHEVLKLTFENCFTQRNRTVGSFGSEVARAAEAERNMMLMQRSIVAGVISERDRLLQYTVGEFFQELSLFIQEVEQRNKEIEKITKKK